MPSFDDLLSKPIEELTDSDRERLTIQYIASSERGDLKTTNQILEIAEQDEKLCEMIFAAEKESTDEIRKIAINN